jgi:ribonuclease H2 subunit A
MSITVSKKADSLFPVVSAASICAKVIRDHHLAHWHDATTGSSSDDLAFGSGYPGDAITKRWMMRKCDEVFGFGPLVRFSWSTTTSLLAERATSATVQWSFDPDNDDDRDLPPAKRQRRPLSNVARSKWFADHALRIAQPSDLL